MALIQSKYPGTCATCGQRFPKGTLVVYVKGQKVRHDNCEAQNKPAAPEPVTAKTLLKFNPMVGAVAFGRVPIELAKPVAFDVTGLNEGQTPLPNGTIHVISGVRYVQVRHTPLDWTNGEEGDLFAPPVKAGGRYSWGGIAVEPLPHELAEDAKAAQTKLTDAQRRWAEVTAGLAECTAPPANYDKQPGEFRLDGDCVVTPIKLDDGTLGWRKTYANDKRFRQWFYLPPTVARRLRLEAAAKREITKEAAAKWLAEHRSGFGDDVYLEVMAA